MELSLALSALVMGLVGGPHCLAMCGAACAALGGAPAQTRVIALVGRPRTARRPALRAGPSLFLAGRLIGYAGLGAVAAASMQTVGWLSAQSAALRPLWTLMHVAAALLGLALLWQARQPVWLEQGALRIWHGLQPALRRVGGTRGQAAAPLVMGLAWGFLPCGLLYSALLVAALSPGLWQGAAVMLLFALGSSLGLALGPWARQRLRATGEGRWAVRLAGACLLVLSVAALWMGLAQGTAPWCVTPAGGLA